MKERNLNYDLIRILGLLVIMIAHSSPPGWLFQLRNFGTPLLVIGSGLTYALIFSNRPMDVKAFYLKRLRMLVLPVWIFLTAFFIGVFVASVFLGKNYPFDFYTIIGSYFLMEGIGFVWVFKIYLMLALITPLVMRFNDYVSDNSAYLFILLSAYILYEISFYYSNPIFSGYIGWEWFKSVFFVMIPYSIIYCYAFRLPHLSVKTVFLTLSISLVIFIIMMVDKYLVNGHFVGTQSYKYPATIYYLSYAFFAVNVVYLIIIRIKFNSLVIRNCIAWLSSNSLWIYLWHICAYYLWNQWMPDPDGDFLLFLVNAFFLLGAGVVFVIAQNKLVSVLPIKNEVWKKDLAPLLVGRS